MFSDLILSYKIECLDKGTQYLYFEPTKVFRE